MACKNATYSQRFSSGSLSIFGWSFIQDPTGVDYDACQDPRMPVNPFQNEGYWNSKRAYPRKSRSVSMTTRVEMLTWLSSAFTSVLVLQSYHQYSHWVVAVCGVWDTRVDSLRHVDYNRRVVVAGGPQTWHNLRTFSLNAGTCTPKHSVNGPFSLSSYNYCVFTYRICSQKLILVPSHYLYTYTHRVP